MFLHNFTYLYLYSSLHHAGKTNWKEEEDEREELQLEPLLERVLRVHHRGDGDEESHPGHHGR